MTIVPVMCSNPFAVMVYMSSVWKPASPGIIYKGSIVKVKLEAKTMSRESVI